MPEAMTWKQYCEEQEGRGHICHPQDEAIWNDARYTLYKAMRGEERVLAHHMADCPRAWTFWNNYALGPKAAPSCLVCGHLCDIPPAVQHAELPGIVVCSTCKRASEAAHRTELNGVGTEPTDAERDERIRANLIAAEAWPEGTTANEKSLRVLLAGVYGTTYADDGELQNIAAQPWIDFKRDSVENISRAIGLRALAKMAEEYSQGNAVICRWCNGRGWRDGTEYCEPCCGTGKDPTRQPPPGPPDPPKPAWHDPKG